MATNQGDLGFRRLAVQIALVVLVLVVAVNDFQNPILGVVGFASGLLLLLAAVDAVREHPFYPAAFGITIAVSGIAGIVVTDHVGIVVVLLTLGGVGYVVEWAYRRYDLDGSIGALRG